MGDLNADCSYASESDLRPLAIYDQSLFHWPLGFDVDTTVSTNTDCAYDRSILLFINLTFRQAETLHGVHFFVVRMSHLEIILFSITSKLIDL